MSSSIECLPVDAACYAERLASFLPDEIIDIHTHVWRAQDAAVGREQASLNESRAVTWPARVADENPMETLLETYRVLLPGKRVTPLIFSALPNAGNIEILNQYVADVMQRFRVPGLLFTDPFWSADAMEARLDAGGFAGAKGYLTLAPPWVPAKEIRILDFFPPHQLAVHNRRGGVVMLHIPRDGRLRDRLNLAQLLQIEREYPDLKLIVAHVGRAYCDEDVGDAFAVLGDTRKLVFDISANTNANVFEQVLRAVGPKRVLFGSDLPIVRMRMRRICRDGRYVNLVPRGKYGDVSGDPNMAEVEGEPAARLTSFLYEELLAFRVAAERVGLTPDDLADVFCNNARRLLGKAALP